MKIIGNGDTYQVYSNGTKAFDNIPIGTYNVRYSQERGYVLEKTHDLYHPIKQVYGHELEKLNKVKKTYNLFHKNMGIILSGYKGTGKTLFLQMLSKEMLKEDIPVLLVTDSLPGLAHFIDSIEQEVMVVFDEFEKVFDKGDQASLLGLFDGTSIQKRLYAVTVNDIHGVSNFMLNRPGRFYYSFSFDYPSVDESREYLEDNVNKKYQDMISEVVSVLALHPLTYDSLSAIAFELNQGYGVKETLEDLNISSNEHTRYNAKVVLDNGSVITSNFETAGDNIISLGGDNDSTDSLAFDKKAADYFGGKYFHYYIQFDLRNAVSVDKGLSLDGDKVGTSVARVYEEDGDENKVDVKVSAVFINPILSYGDTRGF